MDVAPAPILTGLERLNDRVSGGVEMVSSVSVRRRIALGVTGLMALKWGSVPVFLIATRL